MGIKEHKEAIKAARRKLQQAKNEYRRKRRVHGLFIKELRLQEKLKESGAARIRIPVTVQPTKTAKLIVRRSDG